MSSAIRKLRNRPEKRDPQIGITFWHFCVIFETPKIKKSNKSESCHPQIEKSTWKKRPQNGVSGVKNNRELNSKSWSFWVDFVSPFFHGLPSSNPEKIRVIGKKYQKRAHKRAQNRPLFGHFDTLRGSFWVDFGSIFGPHEGRSQGAPSGSRRLAAFSGPAARRSFLKSRNTKKPY